MQGLRDRLWLFLLSRWPPQQHLVCCCRELPSEQSPLHRASLQTNILRSHPFVGTMTTLETTAVIYSKHTRVQGWIHLLCVYWLRRRRSGPHAVTGSKKCFNILNLTCQEAPGARMNCLHPNSHSDPDYFCDETKLFITSCPDYCFSKIYPWTESFDQVL